MTVARSGRLTACVFCFLTLSTAAAAGWAPAQAPDAVRLLSGKRSHIFYTREPVRFTQKGGPAARYEVRDYCGSVADRGAAAETVTLNVKAPGSYTLYIYGADGAAESVGGTMFAIFRNDPRFPPLPPPEEPSGDPAQDVPTRSILGIGPGTVTIGPYGLKFIEKFLKAGGAKYIDGSSFHAYNNVNGDVWLARTSLDGLNDLLAKYGADKLEKWQTENGYFAAVYGSYRPRLQGRWTMVRRMVFEQYGIPKEHDHYWYDRSHGFWDFPAWWENEDGGVNPAAPLMRVWSSWP